VNEEGKAEGRRAELLQVGFLQPGQLEQMFQQSDFQGLVAVGRDGEANHTSRLAVDVMTAVDSQQAPATLLEKAGELLAGNRFHTTISSTLSLSVRFGSSTSTDRHPSTAS